MLIKMLLNHIVCEYFIFYFLFNNFYKLLFHLFLICVNTDIQIVFEVFLHIYLISLFNNLNNANLKVTIKS